MQRTTRLRLPSLSRRALYQRSFTTSPRHPSASSPFNQGPAPPRLPKEEQEIFERLQRESTGAFSTPRGADASPSSPASVATSPARPAINQSPDSAAQVNVEGGSEGELVHPNLRRGAPPEFEGEVNPKTAEVGGPKNEPLRWGSGGDWSFNGRVTDF